MFIGPLRLSLISFLLPYDKLCASISVNYTPYFVVIEFPYDLIKKNQSYEPILISRYYSNTESV